MGWGSNNLRWTISPFTRVLGRQRKSLEGSGGEGEYRFMLGQLPFRRHIRALQVTLGVDSGWKFTMDRLRAAEEAARLGGDAASTVFGVAQGRNPFNAQSSSTNTPGICWPTARALRVVGVSRTPLPYLPPW